MLYLGLFRRIAAVALIGAAAIAPAVADELAPSGTTRIARGAAVVMPADGDVHAAMRTARGATPLLEDPLLDDGTLAATLSASARLPRGG